MKKHDKYRQNVRSIGEKLKIRVLCSLLHFFHMICKISNLNMLAAKHLAQSSRTELILLNLMMQSYISQALQKTQMNLLYHRHRLLKYIYNKCQFGANLLRIFFYSVNKLQFMNFHIPSISEWTRSYQILGGLKKIICDNSCSIETENDKEHSDT